MMWRAVSIDAWRNLWARKTTSLLSALGILVGTASIVAMLLGSQLATRAALAQFKTLGTNVVSVLLAPTLAEEGASVRRLGFSLLQTPTLADSKDIRTFGGYLSLYSRASMDGKPLSDVGNVLGMQESLQPLLGLKLTEGRFISDLDGTARYCVIGHDLAETLKQTHAGSPLGLRIKLEAGLFTIVGVLDAYQDNVLFEGEVNRSILIPLKAAARFQKHTTLRQVLLKVKDETVSETFLEQLRHQLKKEYPHQNVILKSPKQIVQSMVHQRAIFSWLLGLVGSISLIVGGIGVMNMMLMSVAERRMEIGLRQALGAKAQDIRQLFLAEAVMLTGIGGFLGLWVGWGLALIVAHFAHWPVVFLITPVLLGLGVSCLVGLAFGIYPAMKAARMEPIEALRHVL